VDEISKLQGTVFGKGTLADKLRELNIIQEVENGKEIFAWKSNLMGIARMNIQVPEDISEDNKLLRQFGYTIIFVGLVIYTILFLFRYLKRLLMLVFLTIIAPFVAMTYPLDKMNDGNAQAFNTWLKEYMYNLLIQPVHLILYTIFVGTAIEFATENLIYSLVAFGFILQAEKIIRRFFGFEKASTLEGGSALGGALAMQGINMLRHLGHGKKKNEGKAEDKSNGGIYSRRKPDSGRSVAALINNMSGTPQDTEPDPQPQPQPQPPGPQPQPPGPQPQPPRPQPQPQPQPHGRPRRSISGVLRGAGAVAGYVGPKIGKAGLRYIGAGAGAMLGMTAGLVSDSYGNVGKWGAAGAGAGWIAGGAAGSIPGRLSAMGTGVGKFADNLSGIYTLNAYGADEEERRQNRRQDSQAENDRNRRQFYQQELGVYGSDLQAVMEDATKYRQSGITDDKLILRAMKSSRFNGERASDEKIVLAGLAQMVGDSEKKLEYVEKQLRSKGVPNVEDYINGIKEINKWNI